MTINQEIDFDQFVCQKYNYCEGAYMGTSTGYRKLFLVKRNHMAKERFFV